MLSKLLVVYQTCVALENEPCSEPQSLEPVCFDSDLPLKEKCENQCAVELEACIDSNAKEVCYKQNIKCIDGKCLFIISKRKPLNFSLSMPSGVSEWVL